MPYAYMLSDYDEHGAEDVHITLDRSHIVTMLQDRFSEMMVSPPVWARENERVKTVWRERITESSVEALNGLAEALAQDDAKLAEQQKHNLQKGWGGVQLHVVLLEP